LLSVATEALHIISNDLFDDILSNCYDKKGNPSKAIKKKKGLQELF
jgi:hypothetical protein